jgi:putative redox protein
MATRERYTSSGHLATPRSRGRVPLVTQQKTMAAYMRIMSFEVTFPGGVVVEATYAGHTVRTDQPSIAGGTDSAMSPFGLFFASIATCMGFYALRFCRERNLPTDGLGLTLTPIRNAQADRVTKVRVDLRLPRDFPEKYRGAILRAVDHCTVKKHIVEAPEFDIEIASASIAVA